ncbi:MAG: AAA family ATPase [Pseudomonadota bacterium]
MVKRVVISGCSGGGKSSIIRALAAKGYTTFAEPGRHVVQTETACGGTGLPWVDPDHFAKLVVALGTGQWQAGAGLCFYDRSLIDAVTWYERQADPVADEIAALVGQYRYDRTVFLVPPWPETYVQDDERRHGLDAAINEYGALCESYPAKGYTTRIIPRLDIAARADWVIAAIESSQI